MTEIGLEVTEREQRRYDIPDDWKGPFELTRIIFNSTFVPKAIRGDGPSVLACMLTGAELGLGPMQSLQMVNIIEGRPAISAQLMRALVNRAGHRISVIEAKQDSVTLEGQRHDGGAPARVTWTLDDAKRANLLGRGAWSTYPRSMLLARASSELCRMIFPDVIGGLYSPEEAAAIEGVAWEADPSELVDPVGLVELPTEEQLAAAVDEEADS